MPQPIKPFTKLTDDRIEKICQLIEGGNYIHVACAAVGVTRAAYYKWKAEGNALVELYPDIDPREHDERPEMFSHFQWQLFKFIYAVEAAEARAESYAVLTIKRQMPDQWTAAMTWLERRHPDRWRKRQTIEGVTGNSMSIDEQAMIEDPAALHLLHQALGQLAAGDADIVDGELVEIGPGEDLDLPAEGQKKAADEPE